MNEAGGRWRYPLLFGLQTIGAAILFWNAIPHYRTILADPTSHQAQSETWLWAIAAIAMIQTGFWIHHRTRPAMPRFGNALLGFLMLFSGRMGFVLATSIFGFVFITQKPGFHMPASRYALLVVGLFSIFCYTLELERFGRSMVGSEKKSGE